MKALKVFFISISGMIALFLIALLFLITFTTYQPEPITRVESICKGNAPIFEANRPLKVMIYNLQYFAGKDYVFYYDLPNNSGPDTRPTQASIQTTLEGVANLIANENPDILLLQELHEDAKATDYHDQAELLQIELNKAFRSRKSKSSTLDSPSNTLAVDHPYSCSAESFYWQADYVPHPAIMGSVGMKLVTLSKFKIQESIRHQLSLIPSDPVTQAFNLKRAVLQTKIETSDGNTINIFNTHLDAFSQGTNTMERQISEVMALIEDSESKSIPWIIGGDFNLLAPGKYQQLQQSQQYLYNPTSELEPLMKKYPSVPSLRQLNSENEKVWYTHYPNDYDVTGPDRTIDYIFYDRKFNLIDSHVIQGPALTLSDHLPIIGTFGLNHEK